MNIRFSELKQAMIGQLDRNSVVANNLANVNSNGYKRDVMFSELLGSQQNKDLVNHVATDYSQGDLNQTNNPLDVALSGEGFFTIDDGNEFLYTRDGHFSRGADGLMRTSSGFAVMGQTGWIDLGMGTDTVGDVHISMKGEVFVNEEYIDTLEVVAFENQSEIAKIGGNLFRAQGDAIEYRVEDPMVLQGKIEGSNVQAVHEMVELIELQRSFETSQKALKSLDDAIAKAANSIGNYK